MITEPNQKGQPVHTLLDAALAYAARGWHVFPCHTPTAQGCSCRKACGDRIGKHPRTKNGLKDATTDPEQIRKWWKTWPQANIGIATGAVSNLVVLDNDIYKGGDVVLRDLERSYSQLPETVLSLTGGGGEQYFFVHPGAYIKNGVESLGTGLDIRGDGGYVVAPPSLHASGKRYAWEIIHEPDDMPLAPMPDWLLALCRETKAREVVDAGEPIPKGKRNDTLFRVGCSFRARGCTEEVILAALREMNARQCYPPLAESEVEMIATSCAKYAPGNAQQEAHRHQNGDAPPPPQDPSHTNPPTTSPGKPLPLSDYTNARAFVRDHGKKLRYCYPWKSWLVWTGTHWQRDTSGEVMRMAKETVKRLARKVEDENDEKKIAALLAHIKSSLSTTKLKALVENAQSEPGIPIQPEELDTDVWLFNVSNGTIDLRTGQLRSHQQSHLLTKCVPVKYDAEATAPGWERFLWRIMGGTITPDTPDMGAGELDNRRMTDERARALIAFLQRAIGYTLTGSTREQCIFILWGITKTGKSTFLSRLRALLGPYGQQADMDSFMHKDRQEVRNDLADLAGSRFVCALESQEGKRLAENLVKQLTGGVDMIKARFLFQEHFTYKPQFKVFLGTNHKPLIKDTDAAIWERIRLVPFTVQIPKDERDKTLDERLQAELPGILAWAVRGCLEWQQKGELGEPDSVVQATATYRSEMDTFGRFIQDRCFLSPNVRVKAGALYDAYKQWCLETGEQVMTLKKMSEELDARAFAKRLSGGTTWRLGVALSTGEDEKL